MENKKTPKDKKEGIIKITAKPIGFVDIDPENTDKDKAQDVIIFEEDLNGALNRDKVEVEITGTEPGRNGAPSRPKGKVIKVLERSKTEFVGTLKKSEDKFLCVPDDFKFYRPIEIDESKSASGLALELKVVVELLDWSDPKKNPTGKVTQVIGKKGLHETEMQSIILSKGIIYNFPPEVEREAMEVSEKERNRMARLPAPRPAGIGGQEEEVDGRRDFRNITTFTIDPESAKDFDDALSFEKVDADTVRVGVHIADVSHFVTPGSFLDKEAKKREFSTYLVDRTIPMLPEVLSADLCSLNPNVDRLAFSAVFDIDKKTGAIKDRWFGKTIINSNKRFTYENAQESLDNGGEFYDELVELDRLANIYRKENKALGAIEFETDEVKFELDSNGKPIRIYRKVRIETMRMIEDWMLLANKEVAKFIGDSVLKRGGAGLYRVHDLPNADKLESLALFVKALGYELDPNKDGVSGKDLNTLLKSIEGHPSESLIKTAAVRSMAKASYSPNNIGHFGLAFDHYTHFTSPIRRYPDLIVHRIMQKHLKSEPISKDEFALYQNIADLASEREIATAEAERESIKYKQVEYMQSKVGQNFDCIISGVSEWGVYVEEPETKAEGMVRLRDLGPDFYSLDEKNYCVVGQKTGKKFVLGQPIKVQLVAADLDRKIMDFKAV